MKSNRIKHTLVVLLISSGAALFAKLDLDTLDSKNSKKSLFGSTKKTNSSPTVFSKSNVKQGAKVFNSLSNHAFTLGQSALEQKNASDLARDQHAQNLEANRLSHQQNMEAARLQHEHELKMRQMDLEIARAQNNTSKLQRLNEERNREINTFDESMEALGIDTSTSNGQEM